MKHIYNFISVFATLALLLGTFSVQPVQAVTYEDGDDGPGQIFDETIPSEIGFLVSPDLDQIYAFNWALGTLVTFNIDDPATEEGIDYTSSATVTDDSSGYPTLVFDLKDVFDIQPGFVISLDGGETAKSHIVTGLAITSIYPEIDLVTGVAAPDSQIEVWGCWEDGCTGSRVEVADGDGIWLTDFSDESQITYDFVEGSWATASQLDDDGDGTLVGWSIPASDPEPEPEPEVETEPTPDPEPTPVLLAPEDGYVITDNTPEYYWEETEGAFQYQLNVINSEGDDMILGWYQVGTDVICAEGICTLNPDVALPNDTYEWMVRPWEDDFASWYAPFIFTVDVPLLEAETLSLTISKLE